LAFQFGQGGSLPSVRFFRFAKLTVLISDVSTILCAALIIGWQAVVFVRDGRWQALPLSLIFTSQHSGDDIYSTASIDKIEGSRAVNSLDTLLQVPIIVLLLLAATFLTAFYLWLSDAERRLAGEQRK